MRSFSIYIAKCGKGRTKDFGEMEIVAMEIV